MLVFYNRGNGWIRTGNILPTETHVAIAWDTESRFGCFSYHEALSIVYREIAERGDDHWRVEVGPASEAAKRKGRVSGPTIGRA